MAVRVGDLGRAVSSLAPRGSVEINGVLEKARSHGPPIDEGSVVVVLGGDAAGYVVDKVEPEQPPPRLPNRGAPARVSGFEGSGIDVAETQRRELRKQRQKLLTDLKHNCIAAAALGGIAGLVGALAAWWSERVGAAESASRLVLFGGLLVGGAVWGVVLTLLTGWLSALVAYSRGESKLLESNFTALIMGLAGAAVGFLWQVSGGDAARIAVCTLGVSLFAWAIGTVMSKLLGP